MMLNSRKILIYRKCDLSAEESQPVLQVSLGPVAHADSINLQRRKPVTVKKGDKCSPRHCPAPCGPASFLYADSLRRLLHPVLGPGSRLSVIPLWESPPFSEEIKGLALLLCHWRREGRWDWKMSKKGKKQTSRPI